jgi:hypothetical protein
VLLALGCAAEPAERPLPRACTAGKETVRAALERAPRPVSLDGVRLSACLDPKSDAGELQTVGTAFVGAAADLAATAARRPESPAAVQLGYLVGATERGAGEPNLRGIHTELVRRVEQETALVDPHSRALRAGLEAGRRTG